MYMYAILSFHVYTVHCIKVACVKLAGCDFTNGFQCLEQVKLSTDSQDVSRYTSFPLNVYKYTAMHMYSYMLMSSIQFLLGNFATFTTVSHWHTILNFSSTNISPHTCGFIEDSGTFPVWMIVHTCKFCVCNNPEVVLYDWQTISPT